MNENSAWQELRPVGMDICHCGCAYTVLQTVQRHGVYSDAYGTLHYKEPLKWFCRYIAMIVQKAT